MRKKKLTLAIMTTIALAFVACGQPTNGETTRRIHHVLSNEPRDAEAGADF